MAAPNPPSETPWHAAFPSPKSKPASVSPSEVLQWYLSRDEVTSTDFVLVDLRRKDHDGGTILGSINLPAQSLHPSIPTLYTIVHGAKVRRVVWYCTSSSGRGPRAAAWFADYIEEKGDLEMESLVLEGGIKGWIKGGEQYTILVDGYEAAAWEK